MVIKEFTDNAADIGGYTFHIANNEKQIFVQNKGPALPKIV
jgi:hypothetical protein